MGEKLSEKTGGWGGGGRGRQADSDRQAGEVRTN